MNKNHFIIDGVHLIRLHGTKEERASAHGKILKNLSPEQKARLPLGPLAKKNQYLLKRAGFPQFFSQAYEAWIQRRWKKLPAEYQNLLTPFFSATESEAKRFQLALYQPDYLMVLAALATEKIQGHFLEGMPGCTAGALKNQDRKVSYFFRNLDYPIASYWEPTNTVFYHDATDSQSYVNIAALGMHTAGLTAWNESGIAFSLNAHFSKKVSPRGTPIFFLGDEIMRKAKSLQEVIGLCKNFKPIGSWVFLVTSFQENRSIAIELSDGKIWVREEAADLLCHANSFMNPEFQKNTLHFPLTVLQDLQLRKTQLERLLKSEKTLPLDQALKVLGNHTDLLCNQTRISGNTVSVITTVQSAIFSAEERSIYLSSRKESPTGLGPYLKLPFSWSDLNESVLKQKPIQPHFDYSLEFYQALHEFHLAYLLWHVDHAPVKKVLHHLRTATQILPTDPSLFLQRGYFELMDHHPDQAQICFETALKLNSVPEENLNPWAFADYFLGICHDLQNQRDQALFYYQKLLIQKDLDPKIKKKALRRLKKQAEPRCLKKLVPDLQFLEPVEYE